MAFTIIELLVVVTVIALLVGILAPSLATARRAAKRTTCGGQLRQVGIGMRSYLMESNDVLPRAVATPEANDLGLPSIADVLFRHVGEQPKVFKCPADPENYFGRFGTSYEYHQDVGGYNLRDTTWVMHGFKKVNEIWLLKDMKGWHARKPGIPGAANYLYADGRVTDFE
jgi:prepilin-type processing-associated H-X9-DG protein